MVTNSYPFRGPRFSTGDKVRVETASLAFISRRVGTPVGLTRFTVESVRERNVDVDPDGMPYSQDYSEQLVTIAEWKKEFEAFHFKLETMGD